MLSCINRTTPPIHSIRWATMSSKTTRTLSAEERNLLKKKLSLISNNNYKVCLLMADCTLTCKISEMGHEVQNSWRRAGRYASIEGLNLHNWSSSSEWVFGILMKLVNQIYVYLFSWGRLRIDTRWASLSFRSVYRRSDSRNAELNTGIRARYVSMTLSTIQTLHCTLLPPPTWVLGQLVTLLC